MPPKGLGVRRGRTVRFSSANLFAEAWQNARVRVYVEERVAVAARPLVVWEALTDWDGQSGWMVATTVTAEPGGHRVGERLTAVTRVAGMGFSDPMEVTRWEPPRRVDVAHLGRVVRGTGAFEVEPAPGGAWCVWIEDLDLPLGAAGRLGFALLRPAFQLMLRRSLRRLARQVERGPRPFGR
jgi:Polyketide cyclase / dehydrase and lipid transport